MQTIHVQRTLRAPAERVFDVLADHAGYGRFPGVRAARVTRPGAHEPNGVGAVREIDLGLARFEEEITAFERPRRLEYHIVRSRPPLEHQLGRITLTPVADGVEVSWTSTFRVAVPVLGGVATRVAAAVMSRAFDTALRAVERLAR